LRSKQSLLSRITGVLTLGWSNSPGGRLRLRRIVSRSVRSALRARSRPFQCQLFRSIAVVSPHPDDETLGCAGTLALLTQAGAQAHVVLVTDGSASHPSHPRLTADQIAETRKAEARTATGKLGLNRDLVHFVGAPDGRLASLDSANTSAVASKIAGILQAIAPQLVLLPLRRDGSTDHNATFALVQLALQKTGMRPRIFEFPIWAWRNPLLQLGPMLTSTAVWRTDIEGVLNQKEAAIDSYVSQIRPIPPDTLSVLSQEFTSEFRFTEEFFFER
jgi:LmbE family N-acetylglucosaminyl deacetylase